MGEEPRTRTRTSPPGPAPAPLRLRRQRRCEAAPVGVEQRAGRAGRNIAILVVNHFSFSFLKFWIPFSFSDRKQVKTNYTRIFRSSFSLGWSLAKFQAVRTHRLLREPIFSFTGRKITKKSKFSM